MLTLLRVPRKPVAHCDMTWHLRDVVRASRPRQPDRRMAHFASMDEVTTHRGELERVLAELVRKIGEGAPQLTAQRAPGTVWTVPGAAS